MAVLRRALDAGLNVLDTAPSYEDGFSEEIVGEALRGRREGVFLVDKVDHLDRPVEGQVADSLRRLGLPAVDLLVLHAVSTPAAWAEAARAGGRMEELAEERRRGRPRPVGVSSHHPEVLGAALGSGLCDVVMFPLGPFADRRYAEEVLPEARRRGVEGLSVDGAHRALGPRQVGRGDPVVAALVHGQPAAAGDVVVVERVEAVPPVEVVLGEVGFAALSGRGPGARHEEVRLERGHGSVGPAGPPGLALDRRDVVHPVHVAEVESHGRGIGRGSGDSGPGKRQGQRKA